MLIVEIGRSFFVNQRPSDVLRFGFALAVSIACVAAIALLVRRGRLRRAISLVAPLIVFLFLAFALLGLIRA